MPTVTNETPDLVTPFYEYLLAVHIAAERAARARAAAEEELPASVSDLGLVSPSHKGKAHQVVADYLRNVYESTFNTSMDSLLYDFSAQAGSDDVSVYDLILYCGEQGKKLQLDQSDRIITEYKYHLQLIGLVADILQAQSE